METEPAASRASSRPDALAKLGDIAAAARLRRIHVLAWRDVADVESGGSELHAATVARLWAEAGLDVTMRTSYAQGAPPESVRNGYRVVRRAGRYLVFPRAVAAEALGGHGGRDALVEIWNGVPWFSPLWARGPKVTWLHHIHGPMWDMVLPPALARSGHVLEQRLAPLLYRRQHVITLSESSRRELVDQYGFAAGRVSVVPPGVDGRFRPGGRRASEPLVLSVGRLTPVKQFDVLIRQLAAARHRRPTLALVIVGEGVERERLEALIDELDATGWVRLAGRVTDAELLALYRRAWAVTSASAAEGWGMTITEAAACGTPAVVTDIVGHRDAVIDGVTGVVCRPERLGDELVALLLDDRRRRRLATAGRTRAASFTWEATAAGTLAVLAAQRRPPVRA